MEVRVERSEGGCVEGSGGGREGDLDREDCDGGSVGGV